LKAAAKKIRNRPTAQLKESLSNLSDKSKYGSDQLTSEFAKDLIHELNRRS